MKRSSFVVSFIRRKTPTDRPTDDDDDDDAHLKIERTGRVPCLFLVRIVFIGKSNPNVDDDRTDDIRLENYMYDSVGRH